MDFNYIRRGHPTNMWVSSKRAPLAAIAAYLSWGLAPLYYLLLKHIPATVLVAHRIVWSAVFCLALIASASQWTALTAAFRNRKLLKMLLGSTALISVNWLMFVWAVNNGHVLDASFGYYINPLLSVLLANIFLREHLTRKQWYAFACIALAVISIGIDRGEFPAIAFVLAGTFALYGLIRKTSEVGSLVGLTIESLFASVPSLIYLFWAADHGFVGPISGQDWLLLLGTGVVTALPLIWFAMGATQLSLATMGILQYISPTCMLVIAITQKGQNPSVLTLVSFAFIWLGILIFTGDILRKRRSS